MVTMSDKKPTEIEKLRHSASHIMSFAIKMMYPEVKMGVGPWTAEGFYQDYDFSSVPARDNPENEEEKPEKVEIGTKEFKKIEKKMRWIINKDFKIQKREVSYAEGKEYFKNDEYKLELIDELEKKGEVLSFYDFVSETEDGLAIKYTDLCAGPHVSSTGQVKSFKIMKIAGAYWRGDAERAQMTRIYGTAFPEQQALLDFLALREEAEKRDHRKLGKELGLFTFSPLVGSGLPMFTEKGTFLRDKIASTIQKIQEPYGYERVWIPHITKKDLYEKSGHWGKYKDDLFHVKGKGDTEFVMKPMNCPHHTQIFASAMRSYKELPIRFAEVTTCYRDEQPGELLGLSRVRSLTQDDGHVFCRIDQVEQEISSIIKVVQEFYTKLEMWKEGSFRLTLSVRDPQKPEKYLGDVKNWDKAEKYLEDAATAAGLSFEREEGEAAFYGPKLDFKFKDAIGREWQLATCQVDFVMPDRFGLEFVNEKGEKEQPVMLHRAVAGSLERFLSVIIEHFAGAFPLWLSPTQIQILPVNEIQNDAAQALQSEIKAHGGRAEVVLPTESLGKRLRNAQKGKIPLTIIFGDKEMEGGDLAVRKYGVENDEKMSKEDLFELLRENA